MGLSDPRAPHPRGYCFPRTFAGLSWELNPPSTTAGLPGLAFALCARAVPSHPGRRSGCSCSLLPRRCSASASSAAWPPALGLTRPKRVHLRYGSRARRPRLRGPPYGDNPRSVGYLSNEQLQGWDISPNQIESSYWRTEETKNTKKTGSRLGSLRSLRLFVVKAVPMWLCSDSATN